MNNSVDKAQDGIESAAYSRPDHSWHLQGRHMLSPWCQGPHKAATHNCCPCTGGCTGTAPSVCSQGCTKPKRVWGQRLERKRHTSPPPSLRDGSCEMGEQAAPSQWTMQPLHPHVQQGTRGSLSSPPEQCSAAKPPTRATVYHAQAVFQPEQQNKKQ